MDRGHFVFGVTASVFAPHVVLRVEFGQSRQLGQTTSMSRRRRAQINEQALRGHIRFLASDLLEGRVRGRAVTSWPSITLPPSSNRWELSPPHRRRLVSAGATGRCHGPRPRGIDIPARPGIA